MKLIWCNTFAYISYFRYAITDMRKLANRMQFGVPEESSLGKVCCLQFVPILSNC